MPDVVFSYANESLTVVTGANKIAWNYGLNVQRYPTYGGEVVQILSAYVDDLSISGDCRNYVQMEQIYSFFLRYINDSTQVGQFQYQPMDMYYGERNWRLKIIPKSVPGFRYATDVVAPQWEMTAQIAEVDEGLSHFTMATAMARGFSDANRGELDLFGRLTADIGYKTSNPFSSPDDTKYDPRKVNDALSKIGDWWGALIPAYASGNPDEISKELFGASKPVFLIGNRTDTKTVKGGHG